MLSRTSLARYVIKLSSRHTAPRLHAAGRRGERGQVLLLSALLIPILLGMTAMAVDIGGYSSDRRTLQNAADSIALAASRDLPNALTVQSTANTWAVKNDVNPNEMTVTVLPVGGQVVNPTVKVTITHAHRFSFMPVLGVDSKDVAASATAIKTSPGGAGNLIPFAVPKATQLAAVPGSQVTLKYDSNNPQNGNFGAIRIDGNGSSTYRDELINGSSSSLCVLGVPNCTETSPICNGYVCKSETGNMVGSTRTGIDYRIANTDAHCDTFGEAFTGPVNGTYQIVNQCNPWVTGSYRSLRVIAVPVIDSLCNGSCDYNVVALALFWLDGYQGNKCSGNSCEIQGRFVNADLTIGALAGLYDPAGSLHFTRLVD